MSRGSAGPRGVAILLRGSSTLTSTSWIARCLGTPYTTPSLAGTLFLGLFWRKLFQVRGARGRIEALNVYQYATRSIMCPFTTKNGCYCLVSLCRLQSVLPPGLKRSGGIEHLEAVYAWAHTLPAYTTILCCVNTIKKGGAAPPFPPLGETLLSHC